VLALPTSSRLTHLAYICIENFLALFDRYYITASKERWRQYLRSMIVSDETWVHHFEPESKQQACTALTFLSQKWGSSKLNHWLGEKCLCCCGNRKVQYSYIMRWKVKQLIVNATLLSYPWTKTNYLHELKRNIVANRNFAAWQY